MLKQFLVWLSDNYLYLSTMSIGAIISCLRQVQSGRLAVSWSSIGIHFATALFFGWIMGRAAYAMGYIEPDHIAVAGAVGAYMGDGVIDMIYKFLGVERRKK